MSTLARMGSFADLDYCLALAGSVLAGAIMGIGPERKGRAAGLRTHMFVATGAALFALETRNAGIGTDPLRAIQGVSVGVGFVGAAAVLRREGHVYGVSTAAQIWVAAALGCQAGYGRPGLALVVATVLTVLSMLLRSFEKRVLKSKTDEEDTLSHSEKG